MKNIIVWDLDGTLSCGKHRLHLLPKQEDANVTSGWLQFNMAAGGDAPIKDNIQLAHSLFSYGYKIIILTGRSDDALAITMEWLREHEVPYTKLVMRSKYDHRKAIEFKEEKLREIGLDRVLCCFDDSEHVVKHIRSLGVTCNQVTHYDNDRDDHVVTI
ncbi:3'-phosphatase, 5'-polynucleotide kinase [Aeromonas phage Aer_P220]|uniref:3'-phosphatase, 5'-polynucleotide kinase n=1 Tax=Aeromonas phage Aer_P220 TaxID=2951227 RepID=A0A9E7T0W4_9CAUD|nr:3'-phosphatase, 5'-polynucleotide kinase [Aeromonas phage Aer_P220]